jgi:T4 RnlA family RNA ligase
MCNIRIEEMNTIPTREECQAIVNGSDAFFCTETEVNGFKVEMYNYRLASLSDFVNNSAFELRGLTFVLNDGVWERNLLLNKFFNVGQTDGWMFEDLKDKKITKIQDKADGSVISFVTFPDGTVRAKSKMSFISDQAVMAQKIYDTNFHIRNFIYNLTCGEVAIFELCSPNNQIVLEYRETELILLHVRGEDGQYIGDNYNIEARDVEEFPIVDYTLEDLINLKETEEDIEGWVVTFSDGQMAKIKVDWYLQLHGLIGPDAFRENLLIKTILDSNIDDVISYLAEGVKKDRIIELDNKVTAEYNRLVLELIELRDLFFGPYNEVKKDFAIAHSKDEMFGMVMTSLKYRHTQTDLSNIEEFAQDLVKEYLLKKTNALNKAQEWIEKL